MRVAVVGAGGVGAYFGGRLADAGVDTTFVVRGATLDALRVRPLRVESINGDLEVPVNTTPSGTFDVILMAVKAWQIAEAAQSIKPFIGADTAVIPLENGVEAADVLLPIVGREHVAAGLCALVSFVVAPGHIRHAASEPIVMFGELDNRRSERLERLRDAFKAAGVNADIPPDIHRSLWTKFLFIATLSGIGALTRVPVGVWRAVPEVRAVADASLREVAAVAAARRIDLGADAIEKTWQRYDGLAPESTASLQRDVVEGKPSELEAQLGAVVRLGQESGVPTPVTAALYACLLPQERRARGL
jgi:2-dehydropantoate 2-reductase